MKEVGDGSTNALGQDSVDRIKSSPASALAIGKAAEFEDQGTPKDSSANSNDPGLEDEPNLSERLDDLRQDYELRLIRAELERTNQKIKDLKQNRAHASDVHEMRKNFAPYLFGLVCAWLFIVVIAIFMAGFMSKGFYLSDNVLIAFIVTTTANVLGLFYVVAKWLYPSPN